MCTAATFEDSIQEGLYQKARNLYYHSATMENLSAVRDMFSRLGDYKNSRDFLEKCNRTLEFNEGNVVTFGCFEGKPLTWKVLEANSNIRLLFSENIITYLPYNEERENSVWESCTLRKWLNHDFLNQSFSFSDRMNIFATKRENPSNPVWYTQGGPETRDKAFVFNHEEVEHYFPNKKDRVLDDFWWMRTQGHSLLTAEAVDTEGDIYHIGINIADARIGVRPCIWVMMRK